MVQRKRLGNSASALLIFALCAASWATDKSAGVKADRVVIVKSTRTLTLLNHGQVLKTYQVALGGDPVGAKTKAGDQKTPEGVYVIDSKNPHSRFHLALHISNGQTIRTIAWAADVRQDRTLPENGTAANRGRQKLRFQTLHIAELVTFRRLTLPEIPSSLLLMCPTYSLLDIRRSDSVLCRLAIVEF